MCLGQPARINPPRERTDPVTNVQPEGLRVTRAQIIHIISDAITNGLPAPQDISFRAGSVTLTFDGAEDLRLWEPTFGGEYSRSELPYPAQKQPGEWREWLTRAWKQWNGWHLSLHGDDPIRPEQAQSWVDSGRAAEYWAHAEKTAEAVR
jgi:hypothetical protein